MTIDYEGIRERNMLDYGRKDNHLSFLERLYADRTHFIFELVQNAEDAGASDVTFDLHEDRLEMRHNGRAFNSADVEGICGIGESTKAEDLTKIGRFGIGFKSVYAYTRQPEIHSGVEHFRIEKYVRPFETAPCPLQEGETLFIFPFDHADIAPVQATEEISAALNNLDLVTLLFVSCIERIHLRGEGVVEALLERTAFPRSDRSSRVDLTQVCDDEEHCSQQSWLLWSREVEAQGQPAVRVQIAFSVDDTPEGAAITPLPASPLAVFFPTEYETFLGFLAQGPYRTTPARDNISKHDEWNQLLIAETAELLITALLDLRDENLLGVGTLATLPVEEARFPQDSMFRPVFDAALAAFQTESLVPTTSGAFAAASEVRLARSAALRDLLSGDRFQALYDTPAPLHWVCEDISADRNPKLHSYLRDQLGIGEVAPEGFLRQLTGGFLEMQPDEWIVRLYEMLEGNPSLWRRSGANTANPPGRLKPLIRLEDGAHVPPFDDQDRPLAYLPGNSRSEFPTVRGSLLASDKAMSFLSNLGLTKPDAVAEVLEKVLPRYKGLELDAFEWNQHRDDLHKIEQAMSSATGSRAELLHTALKATSLVRASNCDGDFDLLPPPMVLFRTDKLATYFQSNPDAWFAGRGYEPWRGTLLELGSRDDVRPDAKESWFGRHVTLVDYHGWHERGRDGFDPNATLEGLDFALHHPTEERSLLVWNEVLVPISHLVSGVVESCSRQDYSNSTREERLSPIGEAARATAWLPTRDGHWATPGELTMDDLPDEYIRNQELAQALGMTAPELQHAAEALGVSREDVLLLQDPEVRALWDEFKLTRQSPDEAPESGGGDDMPVQPTVDYAIALADAVSRPVSSRHADEDVEAGRGDGALANADLRRTRIRVQMESDRAGEPAPSDRFRKVSRKVWEQKNEATRQFITEQYGGRCQVCSDSFVTRRGKPYFEASYIVSRTGVRWIDRPGNVLCLCATCCAKLEHGSVEADDLLDQIRSWQAASEGGIDPPRLHLTVCGEQTEIRYTEKHFLELQEMVTQE